MLLCYDDMKDSSTGQFPSRDKLVHFQTSKYCYSQKLHPMWLKVCKASGTTHILSCCQTLPHWISFQNFGCVSHDEPISLFQNRSINQCFTLSSANLGLVNLMIPIPYENQGLKQRDMTVELKIKSWAWLTKTLLETVSTKPVKDPSLG